MNRKLIPFDSEGKGYDYAGAGFSCLLYTSDAADE